ncbi:hypothetical protein [Ensifer sesbaniae]|uniref:hypothetical protein n=1 Tax=Ensifer sesbaniae TaxID=1214071 RepID=UPI00156967A6|nr:hypothetical protein [Ensifer sesbaniae]
MHTQQLPSAHPRREAEEIGQVGVVIDVQVGQKMSLTVWNGTCGIGVLPRRVPPFQENRCCCSSGSASAGSKADK